MSHKKRHQDSSLSVRVVRVKRLDLQSSSGKLLHGTFLSRKGCGENACNKQSLASSMLITPRCRKSCTTPIGTPIQHPNIPCRFEALNTRELPGNLLWLGSAIAGFANHSKIFQVFSVQRFTFANCLKTK